MSVNWHEHHMVGIPNGQLVPYIIGRTKQPVLCQGAAKERQLPETYWSGLLLDPSTPNEF